MNPTRTTLFFALAAIAVLASGPAQARHRGHHATAQAASRCVYDNDGHRTCRGAAPTYQRASNGRSGRTLSARRHPASTMLRRGMVTIDTAAGIPITVAADFAPKISAFISAMVARGYHPRHIGCYARGGHVRGSLHYSGHACDFDQTGWGKTRRPMYHVRALANSLGLRDGGEFRDWGHIDDGEHLHRVARR